MARRAKPWFRKARGAWFVTVEGVQHNLGADKKEAFERFYQLMRQPQKRVVSSQSLVAVVDDVVDETLFQTAKASLTILVTSTPAGQLDVLIKNFTSGLAQPLN